jgi:hypothetical protein
MCHLPNHGRLSTDAGKKMLLEKTIEFLSTRGYTITKEDEDFLKKYDSEIKKLKINL